jgi:hypothetical protein
MRRNSPAELGSLSSIANEESRFKTGTSCEIGLRATDTALIVGFAAVLFSRVRYGQVWIVVRGQDVGCCGFGSWQPDLLGVPEWFPRGHATAGQVERLTSISAIVNATAILITVLDVPNRILVGNILCTPKDQCNRLVLTPSAKMSVDIRDRL